MVDPPQRPVARRAQRPYPRAALEPLERVEIAVEQPPPTGALVRLVRDELHDERPPRERRAERRASEHARRVHDVDLSRPRANESRNPRVPQACSLSAVHEPHRVRLGSRRSIRGHDHLDRMPARDEERGELGGVTGRATDVGRPDPGDDEDSHELSAAASPPPAISARSRRMATAHAAANTSVDTRTATAAPVAPHSAPRTMTSGIATSASRP